MREDAEYVRRCFLQRLSNLERNTVGTVELLDWLKWDNLRSITTAAQPLSIETKIPPMTTRRSCKTVSQAVASTRTSTSLSKTPCSGMTPERPASAWTASMSRSLGRESATPTSQAKLSGDQASRHQTSPRRTSTKATLATAGSWLQSVPSLRSSNESIDTSSATKSTTPTESTP